ncbi:zinc-dependent metalloprotease family protein [Desulfogranum mediterraneum]|uniref:zinc-dependent metalloprotease family protein n=1 Tax=Desulfogranum mediterraneum TaxID=160661 RepID=UPI000405A0DA|nr:zinc-dependent metalloprotease family protein [Desulfogranum mediterraneum]
MTHYDLVHCFSFRRLFVLPAVVAGFSCLLGATSVDAQSANSNRRSFGMGHPQLIDELPPGQLRDRLNTLPPKAQARALRRLQGFSFPGNDVAHLHADPRGNIFYVDPPIGVILPESEPTESTPLPSEITQGDVFSLHSKPGASRTVYLDMDGHVVSGTAWNGSTDPLIMLPYSKDSDPSTFTTTELEDIAEVWKRVAEDLAPFDIDVTTEEPAAFDANTGHILISPRLDQNNNPIYGDGAGGVAYVNVWGLSNYPYYQPALVFPENLGHSPHNISEAASHELGHNLGLSHDGTSSSAYYSGHGSGATDWAPIMGVGYYAQITQWSKGEYSDANNLQDDLLIISSKLSYRNDDHEDLDFSNATPLVRTGGTLIEVTTPVTDPGNLNPNNKGLIEDVWDVDLFSIGVADGLIELTVTPAWLDAFSTPDANRGMNIDLKATLYDEYGGVVLQDNPADETNAAITATVDAGRYILAIENTGFGTPPINGYSDYGSLGQYFISGTVPADTLFTEPPTAPDDVVAQLAGDNAISLNWTDPDASPESNESAYRVFRKRNGEPAQLVATLPSDSFSYDDNNLTNGSYSYQLEALNGAGSALSNSTSPVIIDLPAIATASSELTTMGLVSGGSYLDTTVEAGIERLSETHQGGRPSKRVSRLEHLWTITGVEPGAVVTLGLMAEAAPNSENDDFQFFYSLDDGAPFTPFAIAENGSGIHNVSTVLPPGTSGTVLVKVIDTDATPGNSSADSVDIHYLSITSEGDPGEQPPTVTISEPTESSSYLPDTPITLIATANDQEDGDLSSSLTWSCDPDGPLGSGANTTVSPSSPGEHIITASATDSAGLTGSDSLTITVIDPDAPTTMSISGLNGNAAAIRNKWNATVSITVVDNGGGQVNDATVTGTWSGGATGSGSCLTESGLCEIRKNNLKSNVGSVTFSITDLTHDTLNDDSSGERQLTISKP